jgi:hypothetical protein
MTTAGVCEAILLQQTYQPNGGALRDDGTRALVQGAGAEDRSLGYL